MMTMVVTFRTFGQTRKVEALSVKISEDNSNVWVINCGKEKFYCVKKDLVSVELDWH